MQVLTYYLLKAALSLIFLFIIGFAGRELYRLWWVQRITLAPFAYQKDGTDSDPQGKAFSQRVYQELRGLQSLLKPPPEEMASESSPVQKTRSAPPGQGATLELPTIGANLKTPEIEQLPKTRSAPPGQATTLELPYMIPTIGANLKIPEIEKLPLAGIELKVQGVDFASLARSLYQWTNPPDEFSGSVVDTGSSISTLVEWRRAAQGRESHPRLAAEGHANADDATISTACNIFYLLLLDQDAEFRSKLSRTEFEIFTRSLRCYAAYRRAVTEMRASVTVERGRADLDEADRLAAGLLQRGSANRFPPIYMLGAIVAFAKNDFPRSRKNLTDYRRENPDDRRAAELEQWLPAPSELVVAAKSVEGAGRPTNKYRPVQPGVSASTDDSAAGTICCVVRDKAVPPKLYFLSSEHVFSGQPGARVLQPSPLDGGSAATDVVALLSKQLLPQTSRDNKAAGALATIARSELVNPDCFAIGKFAGVGDANLGDEVTLVGRTSGVRRGRVVETDANVPIGMETGSALFSGMIICKGLADGDFSQAGDSGAPVVNSSNQLVGMLYAGNELNKISIVMPIRAILDAFGVELVTDLSP